MYISTTHGIKPITLAAVLAGRLRDRRLIDGPARLAVGAARWSYSHADEDGFLLCAFLLLRFGGGRHGCSGRFARVRRSDDELRPGLLQGAAQALWRTVRGFSWLRFGLCRAYPLEQKSGANSPNPHPLEARFLRQACAGVLRNPLTGQRLRGSRTTAGRDLLSLPKRRAS